MLYNKVIYSDSSRIVSEPILSNIPDELKTYNQWVLWKYGISYSNGKCRTTKMPYSINGTFAKVNDPTTWDSFENAIDVFKGGRYSGMGFMFTEKDQFCGIDYDHIIDTDTGEWDSEILEEIIGLGSYAEISPSNEGVHVLVKGSVPGTKHRSGCREMYDKNRYFTVTGNHILCTPLEINEVSDKVLASVYAKIDSKKGGY
jgi:putative DNA primase/helicase